MRCDLLTKRPSSVRHSLFHRRQPHRLHEIKRKPVKTSDKRSRASSSNSTVHSRRSAKTTPPLSTTLPLVPHAAQLSQEASSHGSSSSYGSSMMDLDDALDAPRAPIDHSGRPGPDRRRATDESAIASLFPSYPQPYSLAPTFSKASSSSFHPSPPTASSSLFPHDIRYTATTQSSYYPPPSPFASPPESNSRFEGSAALEDADMADAGVGELPSSAASFKRKES